jgi:hypothetical protein
MLRPPMADRAIHGRPPGLGWGWGEGRVRGVPGVPGHYLV